MPDEKNELLLQLLEATRLQVEMLEEIRLELVEIRLTLRNQDQAEEEEPDLFASLNGP